MICNRHDVAVVPFPFHEKNVTRRRPVLILSGSVFNAANGWTVVTMITTAKKTNWHSDIAIADLADAGLSAPSVIRMRLQSLPNEIITRKLGRLSNLDRMLAERQFAAIIE